VLDHDRSPSPRKTNSELEKSADISAKSSFSAEADDLLSVFFSKLTPDEAEVLRSSDLANTLVTIREELSAKVKERERARQMSGESEESSVSSNTPFDKTTAPASESKDEEDRGDEQSRSRSTSRKKPQGKRRSSLEKLHDALREMNFDSMMPLGPRRNLVCYLIFAVTRFVFCSNF